MRRRAQVQIAAATLSGNSLRQTVHTHRASVHQAAKLVAALLRVARVTSGLAESNGSLPPGLWLTSPAGWLLRTGISSGTPRLVIEYGLHIYFLYSVAVNHVYQDRQRVTTFQRRPSNQGSWPLKFRAKAWPRGQLRHVIHDLKTSSCYYCREWAKLEKTYTYSAAQILLKSCRQVDNNWRRQLFAMHDGKLCCQQKLQHICWK